MTGMDLENQVASEAVFGSAARGDFDGLSDRDILIVDVDTEKLAARRRDLEKAGWSVASYTFRKLAALAQRGSLFIQHLKTESKILHDCGGRLASLLDIYRPRRSYTRELRENISLSGLVHTRPNSGRGLLWASDLLYVSIRNFGILFLAENQVYKFSYASIIDELVMLNIVPPGARQALIDLRSAKSSYRFGNPQPSSLSSTIELALAALPSSYFPRQSIAINHRAIVSETLAVRLNAGPYVVLRQLEKCLVSASAFDPQLCVSKSFVRLRHTVEDPRAYAAQISMLAPEVLVTLAARAKLSIHNVDSAV